MKRGEIIKKIQEILEDVEYWQPGMIIQEKGFLFRIDKRWSKNKADLIIELFEKVSKR